MLLYAPSLLVALFILAVSFRTLLFTSLFFHTPEENVAALIIILSAVLAPIYCWLFLLADADSKEKIQREL
jgi:hypothetical protein